MERLRVVAFGGGVQGTALLVLAAQRKIEYRIFIFANVGEDSENPATLAYLEEHARPYAARWGLEIVELRRRFTRGPKKGQVETVYGRLTRPGSRSVGIPVRMAGGAPARRACTVDFKIRLIDRWLRDHGATVEAPATVALGFSVDELGRAGAKLDPLAPYRVKDYPLLPLHLNRNDCLNLIHAAGLPQPPKSSCWFCPFHSPTEWRRMQREQPAQFERAVALEELVNARRDLLGKDHVYFTRFGRPLREAFGGGVQLDLFSEEAGSCESGYCWR